MAQIIARLDQITSLEGTEIAVSATELVAAFRETQARAATGDEDPGADLFLRPDETVLQAFRDADLQTKVTTLLPLLEDRRPLSRRDMRTPLALLRVGDEALRAVRDISGADLHSPEEARAWWAAAEGDQGWSASLERIASPLTMQIGTHMERLIELDQPRAERELIRRFETFSGYEQMNYLQLLFRFAEAPANQIVRRLLRSRRDEDKILISQLMQSGLLRDNDRAKAKLAQWFDDAVERGEVRSEQGQRMAHALLQTSPEALAPHWSLLPSRFRSSAVMNVPELPERLALSVLRDHRTLTVLGPESGATVADVAAVRAASLVETTFDVNAPLPERVTNRTRVEGLLLDRLNDSRDPVATPTITTYQRSAATVFVDDPAGDVASFDMALATLDAETLTRDVIYRFLTALIRSSTRTISRITIRKRESGFEIELVLRSVNSESSVMWQALAFGPNTPNASSMSSGRPNSPVYDGRTGWRGLEQVVDTLFGEEPRDGMTMELRW